MSNLSNVQDKFDIKTGANLSMEISPSAIGNWEFIDACYHKNSATAVDIYVYLVLNNSIKFLIFKSLSHIDQDFYFQWNKKLDSKYKILFEVNGIGVGEEHYAVLFYR